MPQIITSKILRAVAPEGVWRTPLSFCRIETPGEWADAAFKMMEKEFHPDVLDPKERLSGWLLETQAGTHEFPFIWTVAFLEHEGESYVLGTFDGNLMPLVDWDRHDSSFHAPLMADGSCIFVVGRQATAGVVRDTKMGGVGRGLFEFSLQTASDFASAQGRILRYFVLESEERSKVFWNKMGFLWPENTSYIQAPLVFDPANGEPEGGAVEETLMFRSVSENPVPTISPRFVRDTIATIYTYWSIHPFRQKMREPENAARPDAAQSLRKAEELVFGDILGEVEANLPQSEIVKLVAAQR